MDAAGQPSSQTQGGGSNPSPVTSTSPANPIVSPPPNIVGQLKASGASSSSSPSKRPQSPAHLGDVPHPEVRAYVGCLVPRV